MNLKANQNLFHCLWWLTLHGMDGTLKSRSCASTMTHLSNISLVEFPGHCLKAEAYFCLPSSLAHMLSISCRPQHMDPVTSIPSLLENILILSENKNSLHFLKKLLSKKNMTLKGESGWRAFIPKCGQDLSMDNWEKEKCEFQRNSQLNGIPHTHLSSVLKTAIFRGDCWPFAHKEKSLISLSKHQTGLRQRSLDTLQIIFGGFRLWSVAHYSPAHAKPWNIRSNNEKWKPCGKL